MSNSREYYQTSNSHNYAAHDRHLPPIRDVVGDQLDGRNPYAFNDIRGALPASEFGQSSRGEHRGPTLPPIQGRGHVSSNSRSTAYPGGTGALNRYPSDYPAATPPQHGGQQANYRQHPPQEQEYAYGVSRTSGRGSSHVHATPAPGVQAVLRGGASPQTHGEEPDKRHKCEYCGKKFDRPSSLQVHVRTHTGSQPFTCEWPGCERSFSVRSNMLRHWRSHERTEVSHIPRGQRDGEDEDGLDEDYSLGKSPSTSKGQSSSSSYYTSSRRK